jgi:hypothetical protein
LVAAIASGFGSIICKAIGRNGVKNFEIAGSYCVAKVNFKKPGWRIAHCSAQIKISSQDYSSIDKLRHDLKR